MKHGGKCKQLTVTPVFNHRKHQQKGFIGSKNCESDIQSFPFEFFWPLRKDETAICRWFQMCG